ncbi:MAG TPA: glycogen/starch synthase [Actinomycetota bacterium]|nr:glycogen/starch synthase [Actinomycetota bacterium]
MVPLKGGLPKSGSSEQLNILFAIAEAYPFVKVGGLGDVGGSLPKALARLGHDVTLMLPRYPGMEKGRKELSLDIEMGSAVEQVDVGYHGRHKGVHVYTTGNRRHFPRVYGYADHHVDPFVLFSKTIVDFAAVARRPPDVIHCNDWHCGIGPQYARLGPHRTTLRRAVTVLTIHNLSYQGRFGARAESLIGFGRRGGSSLLARGISFADAVNTVSRGYLQEILAPGSGMGLGGLLRSHPGPVHGILNGVDYEEFDPRTDPHLVSNYDPSAPEGKRPNKTALQRLGGLAEEPETPLFGMVARLVNQKGIDLLCAAVDALVGRGAQVVIMGLGEPRYVRAIRAAAARNPGAVAYQRTSAEPDARLVYAGSDFFLAPSLYEPCGLGPLIALRYGAIPVVRRTGGMADTITDYAGDAANGLGFTYREKSPRAMLAAADAAVDLYRDRDAWGALTRRAMAADFSWERPSREYELFYRRALDARNR